jgi:topoisomerase-4 subunit A
MVDLEPGTQVAHCLAGGPQSQWLLTTSAGLGFQAPLSAMVSRQKAGKQFVTLEPQDHLLRPLLLNQDTREVALLSARLRLAIIVRDDIKTLSGGGRGTSLLAVDAPDQLSQVAEITASGLALSGIYRNQSKTEWLAGSELATYVTKRARKGKLLQTRLKNPVLG